MLPGVMIEYDFDEIWAADITTCVQYSLETHHVHMYRCIWLYIYIIFMYNMYV